MDESNLPDFDGKVVLFYTSNAPEAIGGGIMMQYVSFKKYGDRLFVEGRVPEINENYHHWVGKLQTAIAWDDVTSYLIFDSPGQYLERLGRFKRTFWERLKRAFS
jgi:hypothetical protein